MDSFILDAEIVERKWKPVSVRTVGLVCGGTSAAILLIAYLASLPFIVPYQLPLVLLGCLAQLIVAIKGSRKEHFSRIWTAGMLVILLTVPMEALLQSIDSDTRAYVFFEMIGMVFANSVLSTITAAIFFFFPGRVSYFKNKVAHP